MQNKIQKKILAAFQFALLPIARIFLRFGIGFREFSEIAKTAFVDVASSDYGLRGRPTNISRVAVMTGLTRKEVKRIREKIEAGEDRVDVKSTPLGEILHRWHSEDSYLDSAGSPAELNFSGDGVSFSNLVKRFGGDIPPGAMRTELKRVGAIEELDDGRLKVIRRAIHPVGEHEKLVTAVVHSVYPLVSTIAHNVNSDRDENSWAQFNTYSRSIRTSDLPRLRRISMDRLKEVSESFDDLFMAYEALHDNDNPEGDENIVAVGVYYFEEDDAEALKAW